MKIHSTDKKNILELKCIMFSYQFSKFPFLLDFFGNPYTFIKSRYYMYCSVVLVYVLLKTRIKPNAVTIAYVLCGIATAILLAIPNITCNLAAVVIAFNKGILDWSDGHLARIKYSPSVTGHILDEYGAVINSIGLTVGLGFFSMHQSGYNGLIYAISVAPILQGMTYKSFAKNVIIDNRHNYKLKTVSDYEKTTDLDRSGVGSKGLGNLLINLNCILDDRARSVDFVLLIILCDIYFGTFITLYIFLLITFKLFAKFAFSFYTGVNNKWAESIVESK